MIKPYEPEESPEDIASRLDAMQIQVEQTFHEIKSQFTPKNLVERAANHLVANHRESQHTNEITKIAQKAGDTLRRYPLTTALACLGAVVWIFENGKNADSP